MLSGQATGTPKSGDGPVEAIRMLSVARRSAIKARTQAINQLHALVVTAADQVKHQLTELSPKARVKVCAAFRPGTAQTTIRYAKKTLRLLARRYQALTAEIHQLDTEITQLCARANPALLAASGIGPETAATLLVTAGDNPQRMTSEASFAALCGASPVQASSGRTVRHRLNRGGDRQANNALWRIAMVRLRADPRTIEYAQRRQTEGKTRKEIIRCLKHSYL
ncbi:MAG: transposase [Acidimicrobiia bacterium]|nr:transposase [Acidimicrobiia bacterium]